MSVSRIQRGQKHEPGLVKFPAAFKALGISKNTAYKMYREGTFPIEVIDIGGGPTKGPRHFCRTADVAQFIRQAV